MKHCCTEKHTHTHIRSHRLLQEVLTKIIKLPSRASAGDDELPPSPHLTAHATIQYHFSPVGEKSFKVSAFTAGKLPLKMLAMTPENF